MDVSNLHYTTFDYFQQQWAFHGNLVRFHPNLVKVIEIGVWMRFEDCRMLGSKDFGKGKSLEGSFSNRIWNIPGRWDHVKNYCALTV